MRALIFFIVLISSFPALAEANYPQVDFSGFKKWEFKKVEVSPSTNHFQGLTYLGGFYPTFTGGPWQERLQLRILGQLSEDLSVTYDVEQQPESPERYDVKVKYQPTAKGGSELLPAGVGLPAAPGAYELTFGDFNATFSGNEFASTSKYLNGVMLTAHDSWYDVLTIPSAKLKSQTQNLTTQQGNNTRGPYNLGHGSIVEGSERIELNNVLQRRGADFTIDYFEGKITFNRILTQDDQIKYSYEYTNILDLFFPTLSKRDFFGFQSRLKIDPDEFGRPEIKKEPAVAVSREQFPSAASLETEAQEQEALGRYLLLHAPVAKFSEKLTFLGSSLKKDEDYIIDYDRADVKLLTRFMPSPEEPLVVEYQYFASSMESETIAGIDSRGPYKLRQQNIVEESERIEIDGRLAVRGLDYNIDYAAAQITFPKAVSQTSQIKANYQFKLLEQTSQTKSKFPKELVVGATILRETAKKGATSANATVVETVPAANIMENNNHIYLRNRPILPTTEAGAQLSVTLNGRLLTQEVDFFVPTTQTDAATGRAVVTPEAQLAYINDRYDLTDGYGTGTILLASHITIVSTSQVSVAYTYRKSVVSKYSGNGDGTRGPYFLRNIRKVVPGTETVQVWEAGSSIITTYTRNASFEANAGSTGYAINYDENSPSITFNEELGATKNFQAIFQYVPPDVFAGGDISQSLYGFDASYKVSGLFNIETAYAQSDTDQVYLAEATLESFSGNNSKAYALHSAKDIIEGTEKISVNNKLLNRDIDYFFSYSRPGQLNFYYINPVSADAIVVEYQVQSTSGLVTGASVKSGSAYRLGAETKLLDNALKLSGKTKQISRDFTPMGGTAIGLGSKYNEFALDFQPGFQSLTTSYSYKENNNPIGTSQTRFLRSFDNAFTFGFNPRGLAQVNFSFRDFTTLDDLDLVTGLHASDAQQDHYGFSLTPAIFSRGLLSFGQQYDWKRSLTLADTKGDSGNYAETSTANDHAKLTLKFTDRFNADYDYQTSAPKTLAKTSLEAAALSAQNRSVDQAYTFDLDLTPSFWQKFSGRVSLLTHQEETLVRNFQATSEANLTRNETYHVDLVPLPIVNLSADRSRQERVSFVLSAANPKTERTAARAKITPFGWAAVGWQGSASEVIPETGQALKTTGKNNTFDLDYTPFAFQAMKLLTNFVLSDNDQTAPVGSSAEVRTQTNSLARKFTLNFNYVPNIPLEVGYTLEDYKNLNNHPVGASRIDTKTQNRTLTVSSNFSPTPALLLSANYNQKTIQVSRDLNPAIIDKPITKKILDSKATYQVASWGTLVYNRQDERNGGEIQAGAVVPLNIAKTSQTYSLNVTLPVDHPVLSNFVFVASLKSVDYRNNNNHGDDFKASLVSFEGMMNF